MKIGQYIDGRPLNYDHNSGVFDVGGTPVTRDSIIAYDAAGQLEWLSAEWHDWTCAASQLPSGAEEAQLAAEYKAQAPADEVVPPGKMPKKVEKALAEAMMEGESVRFFMVFLSSQTVVALDRRALIIKPGWQAGTSFGCRVTSLAYKDITGVEANTGMSMGSLELSTPSYSGASNKDYWARGDNSPFRASNCVPVSKALLKKYKHELDRLRRLVDDEKHVAAVSAAAPVSAADELRKFVELRDMGAISDAEFQAAKTRLLGSI